MRSILAVAVLVVGVSSAAAEPEYSAVLPGSFHLGGGTSLASLVDIDSAPNKGDQGSVAAPSVAAPIVAAPAVAAPNVAAAPAVAKSGEQNPAAPAPDPDHAPDHAPAPANPSAPNVASAAAPLPLDQVCDALMSSAEDNDLPVPFLANLLWQESGLRNDVVSSKGAMGIAQFMPQTAKDSGLQNPFDPLQAISASARLLSELRDQFGNLGMAAAAYNAGPKKVSDWLTRGHTLPRETRDYVVDVTGRSVDVWKKAPPADASLRFVRRLPCREMPAFAELEQAQWQASLDQQASAGPVEAAQPRLEKAKEAKQADTAKVAELPARAEDRRGRQEVHVAREAAHEAHGIHEAREAREAHGIHEARGAREARERSRRELHVRHRQA